MRQDDNKDWLDLSSDQNRRSWPGVAEAGEALFSEAGMACLTQVAGDSFGCPPAHVLPVADALAAFAHLRPPGRAAVLGPGDNGHADRLNAANWQVVNVAEPQAMAGADLAVVVNPGNPDGREWPPETLADLARTVGHLVVDESLADPRPDLSLAPALPANALVLRSLCPLWGLRGVDFVLAGPDLLERLSGALPPTGPALHVAARALADRDWADQAMLYLTEAALRLDRLAVAAGWRMAGGTHLFRLYDVGNAAAAQERLARGRIRAQRFAWSGKFLRLGIPANPAEWDHLATALRKF